MFAFKDPFIKYKLVYYKCFFKEKEKSELL